MELFKPDFGLTFWMFVSFAVLFVVLYKWGWPVIIKGVEERADMIDKGVEYAKEAKTQLDGARQQAEDLLAQARRQQLELVREGERLKTQAVEDAQAAAQAATAKAIEAERQSIARERKEAEAQMRNEIGQMALEIAEKVVRKQMASADAQKKLVDSLLDQMENNN